MDYAKIRDISIIAMSFVVSIGILCAGVSLKRAERKLDNTSKTVVGWILGWNKK